MASNTCATHLVDWAENQVIPAPFAPAGDLTEEEGSPMAEDSTNPVKPRPVSRRLRFEILRRDDHTCRYCGAKAPDVTLHVDHVIPTALGGTNDPTNLATACKDCNSGKGSTSPDERTVAEVSDLAVRMAAALEQVSARRSADLTREAAAIHKFDEAWQTWQAGGRPIDRPQDWAKSVGLFAAGSLTGDDLAHFVAVAMRSNAHAYDKWRYFCGCCWKEITSRQEEARQMLTKPAETFAPPADDRYADPYCTDCDGTGICKSDGSYTECACLFPIPFDLKTGAR